MNYEKAYKAAKRLAANWIENGCEATERILLTTIFPELKENADERIRSCIELALTDVDEQRFTDFGVTLKDCLAYLEKQKEQKPVVTHGEAYRLDTLGTQQYIAGKMPQKPAEWSEEDEKILNDVVVSVSGYADKRVVSRYVEFLKSLPERFNLPPKQEKLTDAELSEAMSELTRFKKYATRLANSYGISYKRDIDWHNFCAGVMAYLKKHISLRSRPKPSDRWKPDEEQMGALNYAYCELFKRKDVGHNILGPLQKLIDDLQKLL